MSCLVCVGGACWLRVGVCVAWVCLLVCMYVCMYEGRVLSEQEIDAIAARSKAMETDLAADSLKSE